MKIAKTIFGLSLLMISCSSPDQEENKLSETKEVVEAEKSNASEIPAEIENKLIEIVSNLPEFQETSNLIDSLSNHEKGASIIIDRSQNNESEYYITIGYNGELRFKPYYHFLISTNDWKVKIQDFQTGEYIPIETCRNTKNEQ